MIFVCRAKSGPTGSCWTRRRWWGPLVLGDDAVLEATGRRVQLAGVTVADFRAGKIRSFRTYFDDVSLIEQIAGV
jgi:hypothetical protein